MIAAISWDVKQQNNSCRKHQILVSWRNNYLLAVLSSRLSSWEKQHVHGQTHGSEALHNSTASAWRREPEREAEPEALKPDPNTVAREQGPGNNRRGWNSSSTLSTQRTYICTRPYHPDAFSQCPVWKDMRLSLLQHPLANLVTAFLPWRRKKIPTLWRKGKTVLPLCEFHHF